MAAFKVNQVINEKPVNCILHKNDKAEVTKMEINGKKFGSLKMGTAYLMHELKLTKEQIAGIMTAEGEAIIVETATPKEPAMKEGEEVTRTKAFRTNATCLVIEFVDGLKAGKKTFKATVSDLVKAGDPKHIFNDRAKLSEHLTKTFGIAKATVEKMCKADTSLALSGDDFAAVKAKIEAEEALEDVGVLKSAATGTAPKTETKAREKQKPLEGYPSWVVRDPQDTIQFKYQMEAKEAGYSAKSNEAHREKKGCVKVGFTENLWQVVLNATDEYLASEEGIAALARIEELKKGDATKNQADRSAEKRCAIFLAKALAGTYKLAFSETADVEKVDPKVLGAKERRTTVYKR